MDTLYVPLFIAGVGIILRGAAFAFRGEAATIAEARALGATFALASVLIPFCLGAAIGAVAAGEVPLDAIGRPVVELDGARVDLHRRPGRGLRRVYRRRLPGGGRGASGLPDLVAGLPPAGARVGGGGRGVGGGRARSCSAKRSARCTTGSPPAPAWRWCWVPWWPAWPPSGSSRASRFRLARYTSAGAVGDDRGRLGGGAAAGLAAWPAHLGRGGCR